jgi:hypothetical protein
MVMFVALITGIITHKKIFKDFFTFRPAKASVPGSTGITRSACWCCRFTDDHLQQPGDFHGMVMPAPILASYGNDTRAFSTRCSRPPTMPGTRSAWAVEIAGTDV